MAHKDPEDLYLRGRLRDAQAALASEKNSIALKVLQCQIELDIGRVVKALQIAESLRDEHLTPAQRAAVKAVVGVAQLAKWNLADALEVFQEARAAAIEAGDAALEGDVWGRLCTTAVERMGVEFGIAYPPDLRHLALHSGSRFASLSFRYLRAVLAMRAGHYSHAEQEIAAGLVHLEVTPNLFWEGRFALLRSAIRSYQGAVREAQAKAHEAFAKSIEAGAESLSIAAAANLSQLALATGDLTAARQTLSWARKNSNASKSVRIALTDTAAQLALASGDIGSADDYLAVVKHLDPKELSDQSLWHGLTRIRYAMRIGAPDDGAAIGEALLPRVERAGDGNLAGRMRLLTAEALLLAGRTEAAAAMLRLASAADLAPSAEVLGETARVSARFVAADGPHTADRLFERATRVFLCLGNATAAQETAANATSHGRDQATTRWAVPEIYDAKRPTPIHVVPGEHLGATAASSRVAQDLSGLVDLVAYPSAAGFDLLQVLADVGATPLAVLVAHDGERRRVLAWLGDDERAAQRLDERSAETIPLGDQHGYEYVVFARRPDGQVASLSLLAVARVVAQARDLHRARRLERERTPLWPEQTPELQLGMVVTSAAMQNVIRLIRRAAPSPVTVLITGETGTGKELLARGLHDASPRKDKPFVPFNCAAVPKDLLDAQLFGHRRGAFTGAQDSFGGVIRAAAGGTLFLDEVGEIPLEMQPKLLRFLESGEIHPLGEPRPLKVDVRVVAATNAHLEELVGERKFREDLYYRLNVLRIPVPPLRDRREEVPALVEYFLQKFADEAQKPGLRLADETLQYLTLYAWPGNVRELGNELRRMVALAESGAVLMPDHLSARLAATRRTRPPSEIQLTEHEMVVRIDQPLVAVQEHVERRMIIRAMEASGGRLEEAAALLGLSRKGLYLKRQRLGME